MNELRVIEIALVHMYTSFYDNIPPLDDAGPAPFLKNMMINLHQI